MYKIISRHVVAIALIPMFFFVMQSPVQAQDQDGVYQIVKSTGDRVWRLNKNTGEIAICTLDGVNLVCTSSSAAAEVPKRSFEELEQLKKDEEKKRRIQEEEERQRNLAFMDKMFDLVKEIFKNVATVSPSE